MTKNRFVGYDEVELDFKLPMKYHPCNKCENYFPRTLDFFYGCRGNLDGMFNSCKTCHNKKRSEYGIKGKPGKRVNALAKQKEEQYTEEFVNRKKQTINMCNVRCAKDYRLTFYDWITKCENFGNRCAYCLNVEDNPTIDHFFPLSKGGKHEILNIVPSCKSCNCKKSDFNPYEWIEKNFSKTHYMLKYPNDIPKGIWDLMLSSPNGLRPLRSHLF